MKHISILLPAGDAVVGSIEGPYKIFNMVNEVMSGVGKPPLFDVKLVGLSRSSSFNNGVFTLNAHKTIHDDFRTDLIIIPAPNGDIARSVELNQELAKWIRLQHEKGSEVASLCMGAFLLASTGLVDNKKCATHWIAAGLFKQMFPQVDLVAETIITDEQGIYTSGGAYSYLNLILYLIEKFAGREMSVYCAKVFQIDIGRNSQSPFTIFKSQKNHEDEPVRKAQEFIEKNFNNRITVDELASMTFLGRRNFERRFKKATSNTVAEYIQRVKVEAAKMSLESTRENIYEIMYSVGYSDVKAFRMTFKKFTGVSPLEYRQKYGGKSLAVN
jgi:transcriptional regulator GlxA family with amidase domain